MEKIPLRAYNREIERLIDSDRSEEALEHCQRILEKYPRCLETHRLLGKAHLELRQYDKSESTFKKVLSFVPDDFIANLGMSLLREKQTNLDGTIWHMERAFEAQSTNTAIQNELRRLYKQRDGVDPNRVNLTRGGLIRMYMRGEMVPQALNEIQSILAEDPSRMDIRILQTEALLLANRKDEALEICKNILNELPYCYAANRFLFENRPPSTKIEEVETLQQRLRELDPYYEFTSPTQPEPDSVKEEEVFIEIPEGLGLKTATTQGSSYQSSAQSTFRQATENQINSSAQTSGWQTENDEIGEKPSWMENLKAPSFQSDEIAANSTGAMPPTPNTGFTSGNLMTMNDNSSSNEYPQNDENPQFSGSDESSSGPNPFLAVPGNSIPAAEPGDIPEWLKALASEPPAASSDAITAPLRVPGETGVLQTGEENLEFLRNLQGEGQAPQEEEAPPISEPAPQSGPLESLPGILPASPFVPTGETTQPVPIEDSAEKSPTPPHKEMPGWMRTAAEPASGEPDIEQKPVEDFRQDFMSEAATQNETNNELTALENQYQPPQAEFDEPAGPEKTEIPTPEIEQYLEQLRKDTAPGEQPEWLKKENLSSDIEALFEESPKTEEVAAEPEGAPDWMSQLREENEAHPEPASSTTPMSVPNVPDWLFTPEDGGGDTAPIQSETPVTHQPPPDWLAAARPEVFSQEIQSDEEKIESAPSAGVADEASRLDFLTDLGDRSTEAVSEAASPTPSSEEKPDLSFLNSHSVDFMNADRAPLTDNLVMPEESPEPVGDLDLSSTVSSESVPSDLAAMLREEAESPFTTNPLVTDTTPELTADRIPGLSQPASLDEFRTVEPEIEEPPIQTTPQEEPVNLKTEIPAVEAIEQQNEVVQKQEAPQMEPEDTLPDDFFVEPLKPTEAIADVIEEMQQPDVKPMEQTPEGLPVMDFFVSPVEEAKPDDVKKTLGDIPTVEEIIEAVTPKEEKPEQVEENLPEPVVKRPIDEKTVPVSSVIPPVQRETTQPEPAKSVPVEPVSPPQPPRTEEPAAIPPFKEQEPVSQPTVSVSVTMPETPVVAVEAKAAAPKPEKIEPVEAKPKETKAPAKQVEKKSVVTRPQKPSEPRPARREGVKPVSTPKKVGLADLNRARESIKKGDLTTALRRYTKLINANKAIDEVTVDLKDLVRKYPKEYLAWQTFGDARLRANRIQEALDAYAKAADLLK